MVEQESGVPSSGPTGFAELLAFHMRRGTRPHGPAIRWTPRELAERVGLAEGAVKRWLSGKSLPSQLDLIETVLFGDDACLYKQKQQFRTVFQEGRKAGNKDGGSTNGEFGLVLRLLNEKFSIARASLVCASMSGFSIFMSLVTNMKTLSNAFLAASAAVTIVVSLALVVRARAGDFKNLHVIPAIIAFGMALCFSSALLFKQFDSPDHDPSRIDEVVRQGQTIENATANLNASTEKQVSSNKELSVRMFDLTGAIRSLNPNLEAKVHKEIADQAAAGDSTMQKVHNLIQENRTEESFPLLQQKIDVEMEGIANASSLEMLHKIEAAKTAKIYAVLVMYNDPMKALEMLKKAQDLNPDDIDTYIISAGVYFTLGRVDEGRESLSRAAVQPLDQSHRYLIQLFLSATDGDSVLQNPSETIINFRSHIDDFKNDKLKLDPWIGQIYGVSANNMICFIHYLQDEIKEAILACQEGREEVKRILDDYPDNLGFMSSLVNLDLVLSDAALSDSNIELGEEIVTEAEGYVNDLVRTNKSARAWQSLLADADLARGNLDLAGKQNPSLAGEKFQSATEIDKKLNELEPNNLVFESKLEQAQMKLGLALLQSKDKGKSAQGLLAVQSALTIMENMESAHPSPLFKHDLATAYMQKGDAYRIVENDNDALGAYQDSVTLFDEIKDLFPSARLAKIGGQIEVARLMLKNGNKNGALLLLHDVLSESDLNSGIYSRNNNLWITYMTLGNALESNPGANVLAARQSYKSGLALAERFDKDRRFQRLAALANEAIGDTFRYLSVDGDATAFQNYDRARQFFELSVKSRPSDDEAKADLARVYDRLGSLAAGGFNRDQTLGLSQYEAGLAQRKAVVVRSTGDLIARHDLAVSYDNVGYAQFGLHRYGDSLTSFDEALKLRSGLQLAQLENDDALDELVLSYGNVAVAQRLTNDVSGALVSFEAAHKIRERQALEYPDDPDVQEDEIEAEGHVASILTWQSPARRDEAVSTFKKAIDKQKALVAKNNSNDEYKLKLADFYERLSYQLDDPVKALKVARSGLDIIISLEGQHPEDPEIKDDLRHFLFLNYSATKDLNAPEKVIDFEREALPLVEKVLEGDPQNASWQELYVQINWDLLSAGDSSSGMRLKIVKQLRDLDKRNLLDAKGKKMLADVAEK